jgi:hypothetical protein
MIILLFILPLTGKTQIIKYGGVSFFLNGSNIAWNNYGWDFGDNSGGFNGGNGYDAAWWNNTFTDIENYGGNCVRIWVHCKGEYNPLFDGTGKCTGLNVNFFANLDDVLQSAENHNIMVILCLFDFHLVDVGRQDIIKDTSKTNAYIKNALIPMAQRYDSQCNLLAWEIINEPEWIMQGIAGGGNHGSGGISIVQMQRFTGMCASAIHNNSTKYVTVGSASIKWNSTIIPCVGNFWGNNALKTAAYSDPKAYLDLYQIHYYDWMGSGLSPYNYSKTHWGLDKAILIGETGNEGYYTYQQQYDYAYSNGYAGCLPWAYKSGGAAVWGDYNTEMNNFKTNNSSVVDFSCSVLSIKSSSQDIRNAMTLANFVAQGDPILIKFDNSFSTKRIRIIDIRGTEVASFVTENKTELVIDKDLKTGMYTVVFETEDKLLYSKIIIE